MKKKFKMSTAIIVAIAIFAMAVWVGGINMNPLKNMDTADIEEITIHNPAKYYTITEQADIQTLFKVLQSMHLSRKIDSHKNGFAFLIDIKMKSGETKYMTILSKDIRINKRVYKPDKNYCDSLGEIFNALSVKYENNPT